MSSNPPAEEAVGVRNKAAAMLGMPMPGAMKMPMVGMGGGSMVGGLKHAQSGGLGISSSSSADSVLNNSKSDGMMSSGGIQQSSGGGVPLTSTTPDLFSYCFNIELKGQTAMVEVGGSVLMSEVYEKALVMFGEKLRKDAMERVLFFKDTSIYLPHSRRADSFLISPDIGEIIELELKKKDKKATPIVVIVDGSKTETVEINPNTTVMGVIQLLPRKNLDDDYMTLFNKKGKIDWMAKVASVIKKEEALECKVDSDLKTSASVLGSVGGGSGGVGISSILSSLNSSSPASTSKKNKSNNRKSMVVNTSSPLSKSPSMTPSSSSSSLHGKDKDKKNLERLLTNRPSEADLKKKNIIVDFKTDAKASAPAAVDPNSALPLQLSLFQQLGAYLKHHLDLVGLFRVSGDVEEVKTFYQSMFGTNPKINWDSSSHDPHIASSALKLYLRKQADPLIPFSLYHEFMTAQKTDDENQTNLIKAAIDKMPQPNASILHYLIHLLTIVASHEPTNKMSPINIGIVFGPTIMWDPKPNVMDYSSTGYQSSLVTNMIEQYQSLWTSNPPSDESYGDHIPNGSSGVVGGSPSSSIGVGVPPSSSSNASTPPSSVPGSTSNSLSDLPPHQTQNPMEPSRSDSSLPHPSVPGRPTPGSFRPVPGSPSSQNAAMGGAVPPNAPPGVPLPKRMPPKLPSGVPPPSNLNSNVGGPTGGSATSGGSSPPGSIVISPSDVIQTRASFRKSLPPNMAPPIVPPAGGPPATNQQVPAASFSPSSSFNTGGHLQSVPESGTPAFVSTSQSSQSPAQSPSIQHRRSSSGSNNGNQNESTLGGRGNGVGSRPTSLGAPLPKFDSQLMAAVQEINDAPIPPGTLPIVASLPMEELKSYFLSQPSSEATKHLIAILSALGSK